MSIAASSPRHDKRGGSFEEPPGSWSPRIAPCGTSCLSASDCLFNPPRSRCQARDAHKKKRILSDSPVSLRARGPAEDSASQRLMSLGDVTGASQRPRPLAEHLFKRVGPRVKAARSTMGEVHDGEGDGLVAPSRPTSLGTRVKRVGRERRENRELFILLKSADVGGCWRSGKLRGRPGASRQHAGRRS